MICLILLTNLCFAQTLPSTFDLSTGSYTFTSWTATEPAGTYPNNMIFHYVPSNQTTPFTNEGNLNYDCAYNKTSRPRINGKGSDGFSFITTSSSQYNDCNSGTASNRFMGAAVLGLKTISRSNIQVTWTGGTVTVGDGTPPRVWTIRLQYRVGNSGNYTDLPGPIEYSAVTPGHSSVIGPITLPSECNNKDEVYLRWIYFESSFGATGTRPELRIDEIYVSSEEMKLTLDIKVFLQGAYR